MVSLPLYYNCNVFHSTQSYKYISCLRKDWWNFLTKMCDLARTSFQGQPTPLPWVLTLCSTNLNKSKLVEQMKESCKSPISGDFHIYICHQDSPMLSKSGSEDNLPNFIQKMCSSFLFSSFVFEQQWRRDIFIIVMKMPSPDMRVLNP